ncbi:hypothetical protein [Gynuella sunshinyii]|uniref:Rhs family protein n=1 Tax=Gynuella sunshinyii YC6258 TaxID=1445510 RepID=A0A0C5V1E2_9GAMM|nr:hypothetical Protein YC6258_01297 [Gynuella sunshinyii YC6258]
MTTVFDTSGGKSEYTYDELGNANIIVQKIAGRLFTTDYDFNAFGELKKLPILPVTLLTMAITMEKFTTYP